MVTSPHAGASPESYQRSSPIVIVSYLVRGFAIATTGNVFGLLVKSSGGAVFALYVFNALQTSGMNWTIRLLIVCCCILLVQLVISVFKYFTLQFRYDDNKISAKKGLGTQEVLDFDWFNVRSIVLTRSAFQRPLNLASISLVTAGSSENAIEIPYIPYSLALEWEKRVKDQEIQMASREQVDTDIDSTSAENEVSDHTHHSALLHKLNLRRLAQASIACGNILADALYGFFVLGAGYCLYRFIYQILLLSPSIIELESEGPMSVLWSQVNATISDLPMYFVVDSTLLAEVFQQLTGIVVTQSTQGKVFFFLSLVFILSILFYLISRIRYIVEHCGFELAQRGIHLQAEEGLVKKRRLTIRRDRVQTTVFRTNFVERSINRGNVDLDSASKIKCRIPYVTPECRDGILRIVTSEENLPVTASPFSQQFTPIHILSFVQQFVIQVVFLLPITLILIATFFPTTRGLIWPYSLLLLGYAVVRIYVSWRKKGYIINDDFLLQKEGGFSWWSVRVAPLNKVQSMLIKQSWIQRIRDRATIHFQFASGKQSIPFLVLSVADAMQRRVENRIRGDDDVLDEFSDDEADEKWKTLPQKYVVSCVVGKLVTSVLVFVPLFFLIAWGVHSWFDVSYKTLGWILTFAWGAMVIFRVVVVSLRVPRYRYSYGNDALIFKESLLAAQTETVRYSRLQSVSTSNSLIDRFFGLCDLKLHTAENSVNVWGLDQHEAGQIRDYIAKRMMQISSTGTDALTMTEQVPGSVAKEISTSAPDAATVPVDTTHTRDMFGWKKFSGWKREILTRSGVILIGFPALLLQLGLFLYSTKEFWIRQFGESVTGFVLSWYFYIGIWCLLSLWYGTGPFIEIPRKGYSVSAGALRYKEGWVYRTHHFVPLSRIQNVGITSTILDRIFKVRTVKISTAADDEIKLEYLSDADAEKLREELLPD
ncbi:MAG: PH domain-containing protein [Gammaproteobacteria bacterium]|nr:PH domain-containing protein [Gammaproteobacteria bacterium]